MAGRKNDLEILAQNAILKKRGYKIVSKLGEGSYAKVYRAEFVSSLPEDKTGLPIKLAVKVMETNRQHEFNKKFLPRELSILCRINHPHIIHIHSILKIGSSYFIFMRFAEQGDLLDFMLKRGLINENQARVWARQIGLALQYLHELNIAHRDIKCENVLVTINYNVKLCDFGFARYTIDSKRKPMLSDTYCGSLSYAAPEILNGRPYNAKISDMWSFGVVIYVMLNKSMPYDETSPKALRENQLKRNFKFRSKVIAFLSNEVKELITHLLEPDPAQRSLIDEVINSDWIAMDKRLCELRPLELAALSNAFDTQYTPPSTFSITKLEVVAKHSSELGGTGRLGGTSLKPFSAENISVIKPYDHEKPRVSEDSKIPTIVLENEKLHKEVNTIDADT